ncbi:MAG: glucosyltransferase domain-containing protein [Faecousia sp.]
MSESTFRLRDRVDLPRLKWIALCIFCFGLVAHGYCFFNANFSHDILWDLYEESPNSMVGMGRYLRPVYRLIRGNFTLPAFNGFLELAFMTLSAYLLTGLLGIRKKGFVMLVCGILVTNSTISLMNATFLHDADAYGFALLMAVLGVWTAVHCKRGVLWSIPFFFVSLGIYQAYINSAIYLFLMLALLALLGGASVKQVYGETVRRMLAIAAAMVLYYIGHILVLKITGIPENGAYNTITDVAKTGFGEIVSRISNWFMAEALWFLYPSSYNVTLVRVINILLLVLAGFTLVSLGRRNGLKKAGWLGILGVLAAIPVGMNAVTLLSNVYHSITIFSFFLSYLLVIALAERYLQLPVSRQGAGAVKWAAFCLAGVMLFDNCLYSNTAYLKKQLESDATLSVFTRVLERMEQTEGYVPTETPVAIIGSLSDSPLSKDREGFPQNGLGLYLNYSTTYLTTHQKYIGYYLGYPAVFADGSLQWAMERNPQVLEMPLFPAPGSIQMVDGTMVVKFSQPYIPED